MAAPGAPPAGRLSWLHSGLVAAGCVAAAFLARLPIDALIHNQIPFATFYPAVIAAGLLAGMRSGLMAVAMATPLAVWAFGGAYPYATMAVWLVLSSVVAAAAGRARDLGARLKAERDELQRTQTRLELLVREQAHRARNTLAVLSAITAQAAKGAGTVEEFRFRLQSRIQALSAAYGLLSQQEHDSPLDIAQIVETALAPFRGTHGERLRIAHGSRVSVAPSAGIPLTLCLHELATNAVKYGALSAGGSGAAICSWEVLQPSVCVVRWREAGGPAVQSPHARGFGTRMIEQALNGVPGGATELRFQPAGLECDLVFDALPSGDR